VEGVERTATDDLAGRDGVMKRRKVTKIPLFTLKFYEIPGGVICETMFRKDFFTNLPETLGALLQIPVINVRAKKPMPATNVRASKKPMVN
jgi:hypothetical protein